jgi:DNA polymerase III gamma/tau subunit
MKQEEAELLSAMAMGSLGTALDIDSEELREKRELWLELLSSLKTGDWRAAIATAETLANSREDCLKFLRWAASWYRDLLIHAVRQDSAGLINLDMLARIEQQSSNARLEHILWSIAQTADAAARIQRNLNRRMVLENLLLNISGER